MTAISALMNSWHVGRCALLITQAEEMDWWAERRGRSAWGWYCVACTSWPVLISYNGSVINNMSNPYFKERQGRCVSRVTMSRVSVTCVPMTLAFTLFIYCIWYFSVSVPWFILADRCPYTMNCFCSHFPLNWTGTRNTWKSVFMRMQATLTMFSQCWHGAVKMQISLS